MRYRFYLLFFLFCNILSAFSVDFESVLESALSLDKEYRILNLQRENILLDLKPDSVDFFVKSDGDFVSFRTGMSSVAGTDVKESQLSFSPVAGVSLGGETGTSLSFRLPYSYIFAGENTSVNFSPGLSIEQPIAGYPYLTRYEQESLEYQLIEIEQKINKRKSELAIEVIDLIGKLIDLQRELLSVDSQIENLEKEIAVIKKTNNWEKSFEYRKKDYELRKLYSNRENISYSIEENKSLYKNLTGLEEQPVVDNIRLEFDIPSDMERAFSYILTAKFVKTEEARYLDELNPIPKIDVSAGSSFIFSDSSFEGIVFSSGFDFSVNDFLTSLSVSYDTSSGSLYVAAQLNFNFSTENRDLVKRSNSLEEAKLKQSITAQSVQESIINYQFMYKQYKRQLDFALENYSIAVDEEKLVEQAFKKGSSSVIELEDVRRQVEDARLEVIRSRLDLLGLYYQIKRDFYMEDFDEEK